MGSTDIQSSGITPRYGIAQRKVFNKDVMSEGKWLKHRRVKFTHQKRRHYFATEIAGRKTPTVYSCKEFLRDHPSFLNFG